MVKIQKQIENKLTLSKQEVIDILAKGIKEDIPGHAIVDACYSEDEELTALEITWTEQGD